MGQGSSVPLVVQSAKSKFSEEELEKIELFSKKISTINPNDEVLTTDFDKMKKIFSGYNLDLIKALDLSIQSLLRQTLHSSDTHPRDLHIPEACIVFTSMLFRGEKLQCYHIVSQQFSDLNSFLSSVCCSAFNYDAEHGGCFKSGTELPVDSTFVQSLLNSIERKKNLDFNSFAKWLKQNPMLQNILDAAIFEYMSEIIFNEVQCSKKQIYTPKQIDGPRTLLTREMAWLLNDGLPLELKSEWRSLFNSGQDGKAFSRFFHLSKEQGPVIVIVKDSQNFVFGGFVSSSLVVSSQFYGDSQCFLFTYNPKVNRYDPTGYNQNFVYFNIGMQTLPNGFGMGGQMEDYFGFFIDRTLDKGYSKAHPRCSTYDSPCLGSGEHFNIDFVEVWAVGPPKVLDSDEEGGKSILNDIDGMAMMQIQGTRQWSAGLKPEDTMENDDIVK